MDFFFPPAKKVREHYFIGAVFKDQQQIQDLVRSKKIIKSKIKNKYRINQHGYHSNYQLSTNLIYLGYLEEDVATSYMENIFDKLLKQLTKNISKLECEYTHYSISDDNTYYKISLEYKDIEDKLNKVILPYLYQEGVKPIYPNRTMEKPKIELLYVNKKGISYFEKRNFFMKPPTNQFILNYFALIKGKPVVARSGTPSIHDQMNLEEIEKYKYYFKEPSNNNLIMNANLSNTQSNNSIITHNNNKKSNNNNNQTHNNQKSNNNQLSNNQTPNNQIHNNQTSNTKPNNKNKQHAPQYGYFL